MKTLYKMLCGAIGASLTFLQLINSCIPTLAVSPQGENVECDHDIQCLCDDFIYEPEEDYTVSDIEADYYDEYTQTVWHNLSSMPLATDVDEETHKCGDNVYYEINNEILTISGTGEIYNYYQVTAPWRTQGISTIIIEPGITKIGISAFAHMEVSTVILPTTVTVIDQLAFSYCTNLKSISLPIGLININYSAFNGCTNLSEINIPSTVETIQGKAFLDTPWLEQMKTNSPMVVVNDILIDGTQCSGNIIIPDHVTKISGFAFKGNENLFTVTLSKQLVSIDNYAFQDCTNLSKIIYTSENYNPTIKCSQNCFEGCALSNGNYIYFYNLQNQKILFRYIGNDSTIIIPSDVDIVCGSAFLFTNSNAEDITIIIEDLSALSQINRYVFCNCKINNIYIDEVPITLEDLRNHVSSNIKYFINEQDPNNKFEGYTFVEKTIETQLLLAILENGKFTTKLLDEYCDGILETEILPSIAELDIDSDYARVYCVYKWIRDLYGKNYGMFYEDEESNKRNMRLTHNTEALLLTGHGVCSSYTQLFNLFMRKLNVESYYLHNDKKGHAWNVVKVNNKYYYVDCTNDYFLKGVDGLKSNIFMGFAYEDPPSSRSENLKDIKKHIYGTVPDEVNIIISDSDCNIYKIFVDDQMDYDDYHYSLSDNLIHYLINNETDHFYLAFSESENNILNFDHSYTGELFSHSKNNNFIVSGQSYIRDGLTGRINASFTYVDRNTNQILITVIPEYTCPSITINLDSHINGAIYYDVVFNSETTEYCKQYNTSTTVHLLDPLSAINFYFENGDLLCSVTDLETGNRFGYAEDMDCGYRVSIQNNENHELSFSVFQMGDITLDGIVDGSDSMTLLRYIVEFYSFIQTGSTGDLRLGNGNITINGDISANGLFSLNAANANINGLLSASEFEENVTGNLNMNNELNKAIISPEFVQCVFSDEEIDHMFFSDISTQLIHSDYTVNDNNIVMDSDTIVEGYIQMTGNVNIMHNLKANGDIVINGNVNNTISGIVYSKNGNVTLTSNNINYNGFIYAPNGTVKIQGNNISITGTIIAQTLIIEGDTVNFNVAAIDQGASGNASPSITLTEFQLMLGDMDTNQVNDIMDVIAINKKILNSYLVI